MICEQEFLNARYKIVYILKEVNGGKSWDLRDFVYEGGRPQTWDNIARWTEGILSWEKEFPWSEMETDNEQRRLKNKKSIVVILWSAKKYSIIGKRTYVPLKSVRRCGECRSRHAVM